MPVNNRNTFKSPFIFSLTVKNIKTAPNAQRTIRGAKKSSEPLNKFLTNGIKNWQIIKRKTPNKDQNIIGIKDFFIYPNYTKKSPFWQLKTRFVQNKNKDGKPSLLCFSIRYNGIIFPIYQ